MLTLSKLLYVTLLVATPSFSRGHHMCHHHGDHHPPHGPWPGRDMDFFHEKLFEDVARDLKAVDLKVKSSCERHSNGNTRELVEEGRYTLSTPLAGYSGTDFQVRIRGRVLFVKAKKDSAHYTEVRTLPTFVDASKASYSYYEGTLNVVFPINDQAGICTVFSDTVTTVPMFNIDSLILKNAFPKNTV